LRRPPPMSSPRSRASRSRSASTPTTTPSAESPTRSPPFAPGRRSCRGRSTAMASGPATRT
jgi:hypothetical protein